MYTLAVFFCLSVCFVSNRFIDFFPYTPAHTETAQRRFGRDRQTERSLKKKAHAIDVYVKHGTMAKKVRTSC